MFTGPFENIRIFLKTGKTDMRKSINGLSAIAQEVIREDPFSGSLFAFCNGQKKMAKILYWDRNGFCIWMKRLEKDRFYWPDTEEEATEITQEQLRWLLNGIDFRRAHKSIRYERVV